jgi:hypothetical protein
VNIEDIAAAIERDAQVMVTVWSRWPDSTPGEGGGWWVVERSYPLRYLRDVYGHQFEARMGAADGRGREYRAFPQGTDPNDLAL